jgi:urate oxidase
MLDAILIRERVDRRSASATFAALQADSIQHPRYRLSQTIVAVHNQPKWQAKFPCLPNGSGT